MNYAVVAIGGLLLIVALAWVFWGRHHFVGPVPTVAYDVASDKIPRKIEA